MTLQELMNEFLFQKKLSGVSPATITDYQNFITIMIQAIGPSAPLESLSYQAVSNYILSLYDRPLSRSTIATYIRNARIFLRWVHQEYGLSFDPKTIKVPKSPKKIVHIYTDSEIQLLFSCIQTSIPWITARNSAIISLMLDSGIRQKEVCELLKANIDKQRMVMKVTGKGAKDRLVPLGYISSLFLEDYLSQCPFPDTSCLFVDRLGHPLSGNAVRIFVNRLQKQLPFDLSSHKLRHNFATNFCVDNLRKNGTTCVYDLSILMGHESMETTKRYEHFAHEILAVENNHSHLDQVFQV
jgi:site-specific recombinase XerD